MCVCCIKSSMQKQIICYYQSCRTTTSLEMWDLFVPVVQHSGEKYRKVASNVERDMTSSNNNTYNNVKSNMYIYISHVPFLAVHQNNKTSTFKLTIYYLEKKKQYMRGNGQG